MDITLNPLPSFVIKTLLVADTKNPIRKQGTKVFINVCVDPQIPEPEGGYGDELILRVSQGEDWIIPIVPSIERTDVDKKGRSCQVWDCCMNPRVIVEAMANPAIKILLVETCIELIEDKAQIQLSREYVLPKLTVKGELQRTMLHKSQLSGSDNQKVSLASGVDSMVKEIMNKRAGKTENGKEGNISADDSMKSLLIQEIGDSNNEQLEVVSGPTLTYQIVKQNTDEANIVISGGSEKYFSDKSLDSMSDGSLIVGNLSVRLRSTYSNKKAYFTRDTQKLHIIMKQ